MKKKLTILLGVLLAVLAAVYFLWGRTYLTRHFTEVRVDDSALEGVGAHDWGRTLTVYFTRVGNSDFAPDVDAVSSASLMTDGTQLIGNSQLLAQMIQKGAGGSLYAIETEKKYPSSYNDTVAEAQKEMRDGAPLALTGELPALDEYDTIVLVYPLWWGTIPKAVESFVQQAGMAGHEVRVVVSHGGSGAGSSVRDLEALGVTVKAPVLEVFDRDTVAAAASVETWMSAVGN